MPLISVITAAYGPTAQYLGSTVDSVLGQDLPAGWELEYVIQEDGRAPVLGHLQDRDPRIRYAATGAQAGVAVSRNCALARARGEVIQLIDHDDLLLPGALTAQIPLITGPVHWVVGQADDLLPDGSRRSYPAALSFGEIPPGAVNAWAQRHGGNWPIHCAAVMARTTTLRALGGWGAAPSDDDLVLFAAVFQLTHGYQTDAFTWLYRQHADQQHRTDEWRSRSAEGRRIALQRVAALTAAGITLDAESPLSALPEEPLIVPSTKG